MMTLLPHNSVALKHTRASSAVLDSLPLPRVPTWPQSILSSLPTAVNYLWGTCMRHYTPSITSIPLTITGSPSRLQPPLLSILISTSLTPLMSKPIWMLNHLLPPTGHHSPHTVMHVGVLKLVWPFAMARCFPYSNFGAQVAVSSSAKVDLLHGMQSVRSKHPLAHAKRRYKPQTKFPKWLWPCDTSPVVSKTMAMISPTP
jgi:hypothetical protein